MRTKDELFRAAQREATARRQRAVTGRKAPAVPPMRPTLHWPGPTTPRCAPDWPWPKPPLWAATPRQPAPPLARAEEDLAAALQDAGYGKDAFAPRYSCPRCRDTGMYHGNPCTCVAQIARRLRRDEINAASPLGLCQFDT